MGLGSNLGDRQQNILKAIAMMSNSVDIKKISSYYETEPVGYADQPRFLNAVCEAGTCLSPGELLAVLKDIETNLGRERTFANGPRAIDIDILFYGDWIVRSPKLIIPHPRLQERAFVLVPLGEIAANLTHPITGKRVSEMLRELGRMEGVVQWKETENV